MSQKAFITIGILTLLTVIIAACASQALELTSPPPVATEAVSIETEAVEEEASQEMAEEAAESTEGMSDGSSDADTETSSEASMEESDVSGVVTFELVQAESEARFSLGEILRGNPKTVVGVTDQVSGKIQIDFDNSTNSQIGIFQINADTLTTDNNFRNGAIQRFVLETKQYEYITFAPTSIAVLPESVAVGEALNFTITGDLTIKDVTNEVVFEATATLVSETRLEGYASTIVAHADYAIKIPEVQQVADVDEEVLLEIDFVAEASGN